MEVLSLSKALLGFIFVLALMYFFAWVLKKFGLAQGVVAPKENARLKIIEMLPIDHSRKLVIVKRDEHEHLLLLGANSETLIETNMQKSGGSKK